MKIKIIAIGHRMPSWVSEGYFEYAKRLPATSALQLIEIPMPHRSKNVDIAKLQQQEGVKMLEFINSGEHTIALDVKGEMWSTEQLATQIQAWQRLGSNINLLIGGPDGLASECLQHAQQRWSLSRLTLPHPLVRIILAEQLYRAWSILQHHPYHR